MVTAEFTNIFNRLLIPTPNNGLLFLNTIQPLTAPTQLDPNGHLTAGVGLLNTIRGWASYPGRVQWWRALRCGAVLFTKMSTHTPEPIMDVAHLGHLELLTPKPEESLRFFVDVMGMTQSGSQGDSVYLRGWDDYERYSLKLTASKTSGMGHMAFRTRSPQALDRRAAALKGSGFDIGWTEGDLGHGAGLPLARTPTATRLSSTTKQSGIRLRRN